MSETICIVLVCNGMHQEALERSLLSLVTQAGDFRLHLHVQIAGPATVEQESFWADWQTRLGNPQTGLHCRDVWFSCHRTAETGFYAAVRAGLDHLSGKPERFLTWLRPGDVLLPGALAHVADLGRQFSPDHLSWVQGGAAHLVGEKLAAGVLLRSPTTLLAQGLCDGRHWPALPQGGVFFRAGLWTAAQGHVALAEETLLAEWLLWQRFARVTALVQSAQPLGVFTHPVLDLPVHQQVRLRRRMDLIMPTAQRRAAWDATLVQGPLIRHVIQETRPDAPLCIQTEDMTALTQSWARARNILPDGVVPGDVTAPQVLVCGTGAPRAGLPVALRSENQPLADLQPYRMLLRDAAAAAPHKAQAWYKLAPLVDWNAPGLRRDPMWRASRIWAWDQDWHAGENTEWAALRGVQHMGQVPHGTGYAGFPWAALIEAIQTDSPARIRLQRDFETFCTTLPYGLHRVTTVQHPDLMGHLDLLKRAGVTDVFWPHATASAVQLAALEGIIMHVIPHCPAAPVQRRDPQAKRPVLLAGPDAGAAVLEQSRFALCPSGTGGHSARLWQVIAAGAIPVIQTLTPGQALPGESAFWRKAAVFYDGSAETTAALPEQLNEMVTNRDQMGERYQTLTQIWLAYGPEGLTHGIHAVMASHADQRLAQRALATPGRISRTLRIYHLGLRAARTPLGYAPLARLAAGRITRAETPAEADLIMTGWNRDLAENPDLLAYAFAQNPSLRCAVISEEPLWDTVWSDGYEARARPFDCAGQTRSYRFLNHMNSRIFDFEHIPYFLLTADHFIPRYVAMLGRYAQMRPKTLLQIWRSTVTAAAFVSEYRDDPGFDVRDAGQGVEGLSRYRTMVAQMASHPKIWRIGYGWAGAQSRRQDLPDWHLDKLARLQGQVRLCASYENTHVHNYISEKPFDAFAVGAIPICYAGPQHRLHELIAPQAMLNTYGQPPETAAAWVDWFAPEMETAEAWLDTTARLRQRLTQADALAAERQRVVDETLGEIEAFLQTSV